MRKVAISFLFFESLLLPVFESIITNRNSLVLTFFLIHVPVYVYVSHEVNINTVITHMICTSTSIYMYLRHIVCLAGFLGGGKCAPSYKSDDKKFSPPPYVGDIVRGQFYGPTSLYLKLYVGLIRKWVLIILAFSPNKTNNDNLSWQFDKQTRRIFLNHPGVSTNFILLERFPFTVMFIHTYIN